MGRSAGDSAILLAVILNRSGLTRARVSGATIKYVALRRNLRSAFVIEVIDALAEYHWTLFELNGGGYGAVRTKTLEAAKSVTAKRLLTDDERKGLRNGKLKPAALEKEANPEQDEPDEDE